MKRWNYSELWAIGNSLFTRVHRQKRFASPNHDVHFMARERQEWLAQGIQSLINGTYTPRFLKRLYFEDEVIDQLHLMDRVLQHVLLKQLKPTFAYVMNPNCLHLQGPSGVKAANRMIQNALQERKYTHVLRADIKSFYKSIPHHQLIADIKKTYDDPNVHRMLEEIITNPIETPNGYKNPNQGIALRGPLSQFFSALYLKPLDDAYLHMDVTYIRFQDDVLVLCKSERQLKRAKERMLSVLKERRLGLSSKKTRMGSIDEGFHFLGIHYPGPRPLDNTTTTQDFGTSTQQTLLAQNKPTMGG